MSYPQRFYEPPDGATQVLLVRHGQSEPYVPGRPFPLIDGHGDPQLTELGHRQAEAVADRLRAEPIAAIYVSNLTRTHQSAAPLADALALTPRVEPDLREVFLGEAEGGRLREMVATGDPAAVAAMERGEWGLIPGAETNEQLTNRTVGAVRRIAEGHRHEDGVIVAFCHGGVIAAVLGWVMGVGARRFGGARHTSISHLVIPPASAPAQDWTLRLFNDGSHAGSLTADHPLADPEPIAPPG